VPGLGLGLGLETGLERAPGMGLELGLGRVPGTEPGLGLARHSHPQASHTPVPLPLKWTLFVFSPYPPLNLYRALTSLI